MRDRYPRRVSTGAQWRYGGRCAYAKKMVAAPALALSSYLYTQVHVALCRRRVGNSRPLQGSIIIIEQSHPAASVLAPSVFWVAKKRLHLVCVSNLSTGQWTELRDNGQKEREKGPWREQGQNESAWHERLVPTLPAMSAIIVGCLLR